MRAVRYDHPDAVALTERVQQEYVQRYGEPDLTPMDPAQFDPPGGLFLVCYLDGEPVATGGWRAQDAAGDGHEDGDAELKRMYVVPQARGRGLARRVLAELEASAAAAGRRRMVLETGELQPEAITLYTSCGYAPVAGFGVYRDAPLAVHLGRPLPAARALPERSEAR
ncbi:GNAT family N-acetyltransferase [Streptantibioticus rubrisoli]|uniref:GNAT family N-acetyltransferase n=1 Tax=Streptantibioticus rubrisoli TaxID=1387313 RepID=A0ABT1P6W3_9ACTN|nr:GNAT family N-acetyltransferase [Streptantibioticus rubrisoli]MCQ4041111.1 GNAT family N-acetyltransferase [Streptantibioticus rubrisoli]